MRAFTGCSLLALAVLAAPAARAQEPLAALPTDSAGWSLRSSLDGMATFGNAERLLTTGRLALGLVRPRFGATLSPTAVYGTVNRTVVRERELFVNLHTYYWPHNKVHGVAFGVFDKSHLRRIDTRWIAGAGIGWHAMRRPRQTLIVSLAPLWETVRFETQTEGTSSQTVRLGAYLKGRHQLGSSGLRLEHETFLLPSLETRRDFRLRTTLLLALPVSRAVALRLSIDDTFEREIVAGTRQNDLRLQFGCAYTR